MAYLIRCFSLGELSPNWWGGPSFSEYDLGGIYRYNGSGSYWGALGLCYLPTPPDE